MGIRFRHHRDITARLVWAYGRASSSCTPPAMVHQPLERLLLFSAWECLMEAFPLGYLSVQHYMVGRNSSSQNADLLCWVSFRPWQHLRRVCSLVERGIAHRTIVRGAQAAGEMRRFVFAGWSPQTLNTSMFNAISLSIGQMISCCFMHSVRQ